MPSEPKTELQLVKTFDLPNGTKIEITVSSSGPIHESDYFILSEKGALGMTECLMDLPETMKPKENKR